MKRLVVHLMLLIVYLRFTVLLNWISINQPIGLKLKLKMVVLMGSTTTHSAYTKTPIPKKDFALDFGWN